MKGRDCVVVARKIKEEINQAKDAQLQGLKIQGTQLAEQAEDLAK